ncbi:GGDEF domain-containing protein [Crossiella cryophila]|uniref:Diguanylate cyclase (GGDEF)-like protein n=1 Tax=Crossiella cryophila TaxID=43355 RepID=A0A7W7CE96_9PSEU|nr:GGDEF domain-containing protein [Crossiella cryophila]MBB4679515.1 diguanylate cyclase (GGDEF)-like protein [Crossiella cryophila]
MRITPASLTAADGQHAEVLDQIRATGTAPVPRKAAEVPARRQAESAEGWCGACGQPVGSRLLDHLTRLPDRWAWETDAPRTLLAARDLGASLALLVVDIDNFKAVNDTYGHLAGDEVLRAVADALRTVVSPEDVISRYGGDEFVALCRVADEHHAIEVTRLMCTAVRSLKIRAPGAREDLVVTISQVTVSIGAAFFPAIHGCDIGLTEVLRQADAALLDAKEMGDDRTCLVFLGSDRKSSSSTGDWLAGVSQRRRSNGG